MSFNKRNDKFIKGYKFRREMLCDDIEFGMIRGWIILSLDLYV